MMSPEIWFCCAAGLFHLVSAIVSFRDVPARHYFLQLAHLYTVAAIIIGALK